jgi:hypothetical protein
VLYGTLAARAQELSERVEVQPERLAESFVSVFRSSAELALNLARV